MASPSPNFLSKSTSLSVPASGGSCNTTQTTAEVLSEANSGGGISTRISPLTKLARKLAGGKGDGDGSGGESSSQRSSFRVRNRRHPGLSGQSSEESNDPGGGGGSGAAAPLAGATDFEEDALSSHRSSPSTAATRSAKRDKFSKSRGAQMQCLNPLHLQAPSSVSKALSLAEGKDVELGAADFIDEGDEDEDEEDDHHNTSSTARLLGSAPANRVPTASDSAARTFTVDLNETIGDAGRGGGETIPLIPTSVGTRQPVHQRNAYLLEDRRASSAVNLIEGAGPLGGKAANGAASASTTASPVLTKVPGLKPSAKNSSSGWL